ncbi:hypothetical protein BST81_12645 [Leptolyngbya sp. 'hensonii']|uniref:hypothetical protein n=1 Tax=Leptolyngbya sp. 'hensonii' TaxID=1922337 RepID=UPI00094F5D8B|nr:hypothetical protein [Leptolyngbya sp. 'hensonii']OLP17901.1 hypothetical protein BST81_12645 [Leptolyngbya sp. 'hensonii']
MSLTVTGKVEKKGFGPGTWALVSESGQTYELHNPPQEMLKAGQQVKVEGEILKNVMTFAMIGPVLQVNHYELR